MHPRLTQTDFGKNAINSRPDVSHMRADTAEAVAEKILELIKSEEAEGFMV